jgi:ABC-type branched-subunit amino acid transport system substrate-binding protein
MEGEMKKRFAFVGLFVLLFVIALTVVACGTTTTTAAPASSETTAPASTETTAPASTETTAPASTETTAASTEPIKVGHIVDLTGFEANVGSTFKAGLDYAFTNAKIGSRPVQVVEVDSKSDTAAAVDAAKRLVEQEKVSAIFGPTQIGQKTAVAEYCKSVGVPLILYNPTPLDAVKDNPWVFAFGGTPNQTASVSADYAYTDLGYKTVTMITTDDTAGRSWADPWKAKFEALGGKVVQQQWTPFSDDYTSYLTAMDEADAVVAWFGGSSGIAFLSQYLELGIDKKMPIIALYHGGFTDPWLINTIAKDNPDGAKRLVGTIAPMAWDPDSKDQASVDFVKGLTPLLPYGPPGDAGYSCTVQAVQGFLAAAATIQGDLTGDALSKALLADKFTGPEGPEFFAAGDQAATKNVYIMKVISIDIPGKGTIYKYATVKPYEAVPPTGLK